MWDKFKNLSGFSKGLVIAGAIVLLVCIGLVIAVFATGGFNGIK